MNTYPHDLERLRHYGLRGHTQHAKELRQRRMMVKAGWLLLAALFLSALASYAHADTQTWRLTIGIYSTAEGHTNRLKSYRDIIRIPAFKSAEDCREAGRYAQDDFLTRPDSRTMTNDLLDYACTEE